MENKPLPKDTWKWPQSKLEAVNPQPLKAYICAPSGLGKTTLVVNLLRGPLKGLYTRVIIVSHTVFVDPSWRPVLQMLRQNMENHGLDPDDEDEKWLYDHWDAAALQRSVDLQYLRIKRLRDEGETTGPMSLYILDDMLDSGALRSSKLLQSLAARGRHTGTGFLITSQAFKGAHPIIRKNIDFLAVFNNLPDQIEAIAREVPISREKFMALFASAVKERGDFLWIALKKPLQDMFYASLQKKLTLVE